MAVLHSYAQSSDKTGYYLKGWTQGKGNTTIQTRRIGDDLFEWLGFSIGDQVPQELLNGLLEVGILYTGDPTTAAENLPDDFDLGHDVENVLTEQQYNRLIGFVKSYGNRNQAPSSVVDLINQLDAQTAVVDDSYIPDTPGGSDRGNENVEKEVDHGRFEGIIEQVYIENEDTEVVDTLSDLKNECHSAKSAVSYHNHYQEIFQAEMENDKLEYATRALVDNKSGLTAGPACGFRVGIKDAEIVVVEIIIDPDDPTRLLSYGEKGIRHRVFLGEDQAQWETSLYKGSAYTNRDARSVLLAHQIEALQILETTLERHPGISKSGMIEQIVDGGYLERGTRTTEDVWQDSNLLGELLSSDSSDQKAKGTVKVFFDKGGYGFIETDARDEDVFYHMQDVGGPDIQEGQQLRFSIIETEKGLRAEDVERI